MAIEKATLPYNGASTKGHRKTGVVPRKKKDLQRSRGKQNLNKRGNHTPMIAEEGR